MTRHTPSTGDTAPKTTAPKPASPKTNGSKAQRKSTATSKPAQAPIEPQPLSRLAAHEPPARSGVEAEERYVAARDAWTAAMRAANSGRPADLASLAIAQEAYEAAVAERQLWESGERFPMRAQDESMRTSIEAAVGQELAWRKVLHPDPPKGGVLGRIRRRLTGR